MNTVIITEEGRGINSMDYWGYALEPFVKIEDGSGDEIHGLNLIACWGSREEQHNSKNIVISTFFGLDPQQVSHEICQALESLLDTIKDGEESLWDVREHNSNL